MSDCKVVQLIRTNLLLRGEGKEDNPYRRIEQYYDFEGSLVFEIDNFLLDQREKELRDIVSVPPKESPDKGS